MENKDKNITISFRRVSICMGDDAGNGEWIINMPGDSTVKDLVDAVITYTFGARPQNDEISEIIPLIR